MSTVRHISNPGAGTYPTQEPCPVRRSRRLYASLLVLYVDQDRTDQRSILPEASISIGHQVSGDRLLSVPAWSRGCAGWDCTGRCAGKEMSTWGGQWVTDMIFNLRKDIRFTYHHLRYIYCQKASIIKTQYTHRPIHHASSRVEYRGRTLAARKQEIDDGWSSMIHDQSSFLFLAVDRWSGRRDRRTGT